MVYCRVNRIPDLSVLPRKPSFALFAAGLLGASAACQAVGLGAMGGEPVIGEPLQLKLPLTGTIDRSLDQDCVSVRRPTDSLDADYFPRDLLARVDRQASPPQVLLTTTAAVRQPIIEFRLVVGCGYNLSHDYLLMSSLRTEDAEPAVVPTPPAAAPLPVPSRSSTAETPGPTGAEARASQVEVAGLPDGMRARTITLDRDQTAAELARQHFPGPLRQERFVRWVAEANPEQFPDRAGAGQQRLSAGSTVFIPDGVPPRRPGDRVDGAASRSTAKQQAAALPPPKPKTRQATVPSTPRSGGNGKSDRLVVGSGNAGHEDVKETMAVVERLSAMLEQQLVTQRTSDEKIARLEALLADLAKQLAKIDADGRERESRWRAALETEQAVRLAPAHQAWWPLFLAALLGGGLGAGLLHVLQRRAARRNRAALDIAPATRSKPRERHEATPARAPVHYDWNDAPVRRSHDAGPAGQPAVGPAAATVAPTPAPPAAELRLVPPDAAPETSGGTSAEPPPDTAPNTQNPAVTAVELANVMTAMGLVSSAAETLVEHLRENPRESLHHWLKLLELYRSNGNRSEFTRSADELRQHFNVQADEWDSKGGSSGRGSLETYPHIRAQIIQLWNKPECLPFLQSLLMDNREGTRSGFPLAVAEEILMLIAIQGDRP